MSKEVTFTLLFLSAVLIASFSQILLKKSAQIKYNNSIEEYLNKYVIIAYLLFLSSTLLVMYSYRVVPLYMGPILESMGIIFVLTLSNIFLKEELNKGKIIGVIIIFTGVIIASF